MKTLLLVMTIILQPAEPKEPVVKRGNTPGDWLFINPTKAPVRFFVSCGSEWEPVVVDAKPREGVYQRIEGPDGSTPYCFLDHWEKR